MTYNALRRGRVSEAGREYLVTAVTCERQPFFENFTAARQTVQELHRLHETDMVYSLAWVLMPDHLHWLIALGEATPLPAAMQRFKGRSTRELNTCLQRTGPVWQPGFQDRALRRDEARVAVARYIVANPLRAGLVERIGDYPHWDAMWLE